jgi:hypothetical protein
MARISGLSWRACRRLERYRRRRDTTLVAHDLAARVSPGANRPSSGTCRLRAGDDCCRDSTDGTGRAGKRPDGDHRRDGRVRTQGSMRRRWRGSAGSGASSVHCFTRDWRISLTSRNAYRVALAPNSSDRRGAAYGGATAISCTRWGHEQPKPSAKATSLQLPPGFVVFAGRASEEHESSDFLAVPSIRP